MSEVRISSNWKHPAVMKWLGVVNVSDEGTLERSLDIPEEVYTAIEVAIVEKFCEGDVFLKDKSRFQWFHDVSPQPRTKKSPVNRSEQV